MLTPSVGGALTGTTPDATSSLSGPNFGEHFTLHDGFVVIGTAPTGHTLLLLDAAEAYHRDVARNLSYIPDSVRRLLPQLRDPEFTRILIVTLPEATPVHEAERLQEDLKRAGIHPYAWVINQSFRATDTKDPVLASADGLKRVTFPK
jgi:anion-transporting  ArsA/GET3 family ATPase